jgi:hypothetical protein
MRKAFVMIVLLSVLLALAACTPVQQSPVKFVCSDGSVVQDPSSCPAVKAPIETPPVQNPVTPPVVQEEPPVQIAEDQVVTNKILTDDAKALFDKSIKANNLKFNYFHSDDPYTQNLYTATRQRIKIALLTKEKYTAKELFDTVYLDLQNKIASAYCEDLSSGVCPDRNNRLNVSYAKYKIRTPYNWLDIVQEASLTTRSKKISGREAKEASFKADGKDGTMWIDSYFGIPIEVNYDSIQYVFQNMLVNDAKDPDLYHTDIQS